MSPHWRRNEPHAVWFCRGHRVLRTTGTIAARRPISVTVIQEDGSTAVFRCAPTGDGRLPPVVRTVAFGGRR